MLWRILQALICPPVSGGDRVTNYAAWHRRIDAVLFDWQAAKA